MAIAPGEIGRFPLPKTYDIRRDYPHNHLLNYRTIELLFADGRSMTINCNRMNQGRCKTSIAVQDNQGVLIVTDCDEIAEVKEEKDESAVSKSCSMKMMQFIGYGASLVEKIESGQDGEDMEKVMAFLNPIAKSMDESHKAEREEEERERAAAKSME